MWRVGAGIVVCMCIGCDKQDPPKSQGNGVEVNAPGVNVKVGEKGAVVTAPGVNVKAGGKGAEVKFPGGEVKVKE